MLTRDPSTPQSSRAERFSKARAAFAFAAALVSCAAAHGPARTFAQTSAQREVPATVTGRVTDGERGLPGVAVVLTSSDPAARFREVAHAKTDAEGNYRLANVPPGNYKVMPFAPVYVVEGMSMYDYPPGKPLNLAAGESVENIDFRLERGGVITGRVTDADGNPVIAERVSFVPADKNQQQMMRGPSDPRDYSTDDRGVYRIYGLPPGRYHVSAGQDGDAGAVSFGRRKLYRRTFYPEATNESQAKVVEVTASGETGDVDITLGRAVKTYRASGRFVSAETGRPVANISYGYGPFSPDGRFGGGLGTGFATNERGEFQADGLAPGHYAIFVASFGRPQDNGEFYSDPVTFDVADADVTGIVVKLHTGASVSGVVMLEGVGDRATAARLLPSVRLYGSVETPDQWSASNFGRQVAVAADGSFRIAGLRPGKLRIFLNGVTKGLTLSRVELNGANVTGGVDIVEGAQVAGLRVIVAYGSGVIRGQINFAGGEPPQGARVFVSARRVGAGGGGDAGLRPAQADARGRFVIQGLPPGEYEVQARVIVFQPGARPSQSESQHVSLGEGGDMSVTLTVDLSAPAKGGRP
jgi:hypothetical protein